MTLPIIDLHCDMLHYLATTPNAVPSDSEAIGCAIPRLREGHVRLQVMAAFSSDGKSGPAVAQAECNLFRRMVEENSDALMSVSSPDDLRDALSSDKTGVVAAIENASGLCGEDEPLEMAFERLARYHKQTGGLLYLSLTHHGANRFGGGNYMPGGLTGDGRALLEFMSGMRIALDLAHTSDPLAHDCINWIDSRGLDIPLIASHSNFRAVFDHARNLPDELAQEIMTREGLIGVNFLRAFMHPTDPEALIRHIVYGFEHGGEKAICFGADFFDTTSLADPKRVPYYFREHEHAGRYPAVLASLEDHLSDTQREDLACRNAERFFARLRSDSPVSY